MEVRAKVRLVAAAGILLVNMTSAYAQSQAQVQGSQLMQSMMQMTTRAMGGPYERAQPDGPLLMNPAVALNPVTMWAPMMTMANPFVFLNPLMSTTLMKPATYVPFMNPAAYAAMLNPNLYAAGLIAPTVGAYSATMPTTSGAFVYPGTVHSMMDPDAYARWYADLQQSIMSPDQYKEMYERMQKSHADRAATQTGDR